MVSRKSSAGFTLIELLCALAIVAVIFTLVYGVVFLTIEGKDRITKISALNKVGQGILKKITKDIEGCYIRPDRKPNENIPFAGLDDGTQDRLDFLTTTPSKPDAEGIRTRINEVGYKLLPREDDSDFFVLLRRESPLDGDPLSGGNFSEIYDRVRQLNIQYLDGEDWCDSWEDQKNLPLAVKVELVIYVFHYETEEQMQQELEEQEELELEEQKGYFSAVISLPLAQGTNPVPTP